MDPLTAIGLASNILSFIDFGVKLTAAAYEVYGSADGATIDVVNAKVTNADLLGLLDRLQPPPQTPDNPSQDDQQRLENLRARCFTVAGELNKKLQSVSLDDLGNRSAWKSFKVAIKSIWSKKDIAEFQTQLGVFTQEIELHILMDLRSHAQTLESVQRYRFDSLEQDIKITARSIEFRLSKLRSIVEEQGMESKIMHQETLKVIDTSNNGVIEVITKDGDATRASVARTEAVIIDKLDQLGIRRQDTMKPLLVESRFVCDPEQFIPRVTYINAISEGFKISKEVLLVGLGGVGKSQIAIDYANHRRRDDPGLSYVWVYGSTQATFIDSYRKILGHIPLQFREEQAKIIRSSSGSSVNFGYTDEEVLRLVCGWFSSAIAGQWLMILDNVDDLATFRSRVGHAQLKNTLPQSDLGHLLITSRTQQVSSQLISGGQKCVVQVKPMRPKEAETMFRTLLPSVDETDAQISELASKLDFLPLAIRQATSFIASSCGGTNISSYSRMFDSTQYQSRLLKADFADITYPEGITRSLVVTWQISFDRIAQERPGAAGMLAFLGTLSREGIPILLLKALQPDEFEFSLDLGLLIQYSLVDQDAKNNLLSLHRLVQMTIRLWLIDTRIHTTWHDLALEILRKEFLRAMLDDDAHRRDMATCKALRIHVLEICRYVFESEDSRRSSLELKASMKEFDQLGLVWLQAGDVTEVHRTVRVKCVPGTGQWFFNHCEYQRWISSPAGSVLWIIGRQGDGKSCLCSQVIDHFIDVGSKPPQAYKTLFMYLRFNMEFSTGSIFRELLRQFCSGEDHIPSAVEEMNKTYETTSEMPSIEKLLQVFQSVVERSTSKVVVVIDGLDVAHPDLLEPLAGLIEATIPNLYLLISTRAKVEIQHILQNALCIDIQAESFLFIEQYITEKLESLDMFRRHMSQGEQTRFIEELVQQSEGRISWVTVVINDMIFMNEGTTNLIARLHGGYWRRKKPSQEARC